MKMHVIAGLVGVIAVLPAPATAAGGVEVRKLVCDAPGDDAENLNGEVLAFRNNRTMALRIGGWTVTDEAGTTYTVVPADRQLPPGATIRLHTGRGTDTNGALFWNRGASVWNNDGDRAVIRNRAGTRVASSACTDLGSR